jgi:hypothetical protein
MVFIEGIVKAYTDYSIVRKATQIAQPFHVSTERRVSGLK